MSTQKGNTKRSRPQKYQNHFAFKNTLFDTSHKTKKINSLQIANVCERCKKILEWKIKYKKYKPLKAPGKCNKCDQKTIKHAYHSMCGPCASQRRVCPKCGQQSELVQATPSKEEQIQLDVEMQAMLKTLPERKRRTFLRYVNKQNEDKDKKKKKKRKDNKEKDGKGEYSENNGEEEDEDQDEDEDEDEEKSKECNREHLLEKLKALMVDDKDDDFGSDFSDDDDYGDDDDDDDDDDDNDDDNDNINPSK